MANFKRDWTAREPFFVAKNSRGAGYYVTINERKLITENPYEDLINSLEEMLATAKAQHALNPVP